MTKTPYTPCKNKPLKVKQFVAEFNFPYPDWSSLPAGFPNLNKRGLTKEEGHLLDGITLAWITSDGREVFYKTLARRTVVIVVLIFVVLFGRSVLTSTNKSVTRTVSAKVMGERVGDFVEATMSAVFRK